MPNNFQPKILLVDDNPDNLQILSVFLQVEGFEILVAKDGDIALKQLENEIPDLILLDILMPTMNGYEVCRQIKENAKTAHIPIIFMTALSDVDSVIEGFAVGAVDYVVKPFRKEIVLARIKTHLKMQQLNSELQDKNARLESLLAEQREVSEMKSRFISVVSHDLRTPLTIILTTNGLLQQFGQNMTEEKRQIYYNRINSSVTKMKLLLNDILLASKSELNQIKFNPEMINLDLFCQEIFREFEFLSIETHPAIFTKEVDPDLAIAIDRSLMWHVLSNLYTNAIKYSDHGHRIHFSVIQEDQQVIFKIEDEGIGIPAGDLAKLFEPFRRAGNVGAVSGSGLGLWIVKEFVEMHGGTIRVMSSEGKGTAFTIALPIRC